MIYPVITPFVSAPFTLISLTPAAQFWVHPYTTYFIYMPLDPGDLVPRDPIALP